MATLRKAISTFAVVVLISISGCSNDPTSKFPQFDATANTQRAVFFTTTGWTGVAGEPLLLKPQGRPAKVNGLPVYLDSDTSQSIRKQLGKQPPDCKNGTILVDAQIHLKQSGLKTSAKGGGRKSVYVVVIEELHYCGWYIEN